MSMFLRPETISFQARCIGDTNLEVFGLKNIGRGNFTSCQPKRVNTKKNYFQKLDPICSLHAKFGFNLTTGGRVMDGFTYKSKLCCPPFYIIHEIVDNIGNLIIFSKIKYKHSTLFVRQWKHFFVKIFHFYN